MSKRVTERHQSEALRLLARAIPGILHLLLPGLVALCAGLMAEWTPLQMLAFAWALVLLWHTVLRWTGSEAFGLLRNPWAGLLASAAFAVLVWWSFFVTGHGGVRILLALNGGGGVPGPDVHVRFASLIIVTAPAVPYAFDTLAGLLGLRDD